MPERYIDPNSGAAPQPGGFAAAPMVERGGEPVDVAVADEVTEADEASAAPAEDHGDGGGVMAEERPSRLDLDAGQRSRATTSGMKKPR